MHIPVVLLVWFYHFREEFMAKAAVVARAKPDLDNDQ